MNAEAYASIRVSEGRPALLAFTENFEYECVRVRAGSVFISVAKSRQDTFWLISHRCDSCQVTVRIRAPRQILRLVRDHRVFRRTPDQRNWRVPTVDLIDQKIESKYRSLGVKRVPPESVVLGAGRNLNVIVSYYRRMRGQYVFCKFIAAGYGGRKRERMQYKSFIARLEDIAEVDLRNVLFSYRREAITIALCYIVDLRLCFRKPVDYFYDLEAEFIFDGRADDLDSPVGMISSSAEEE